MSAKSILEHPSIAHLAKALRNREPSRHPDATMRRAAVALIFRGDAVSGEPELLFIKRAEYPGDPWSGQIAFPGGRREAGDESLEGTVIRETREETGVDLSSQGQILGRLDELEPQSVRLPEIVVCPFVAVVYEPPMLTLTKEVAAAFWLPLKSLQHGGSWRDTEIVARGLHMTCRAFHHEGHVIWGITERLIAGLLSLLAD